MSKKESKKELEREKFHKKFKRKYVWRIATIALFALLIASVFTGGFKDFKNIDSQEAVDQAIEYINVNLLQGEATASLKGITDSEIDSLYKFNIEIGGRAFPSYVTKDGKYLIPQELIDTTEEIEPVTTPQTTGSATGSYSDEDSAKIESFVNCLAEKGLKVYGANWCGWTKRLVTTFGGFDKVGPIYVECTEEKETCSQEGVTGYPTIKLNGEIYEDKREFEAFAKATGCEAPDIEVQVATGSDSGGCA